MARGIVAHGAKQLMWANYSYLALKKGNNKTEHRDIEKEREERNFGKLP